jgi:serine/threonine protein kinase
VNDPSKSDERKDPQVAAALRDYLERVDRGEPVNREEFLSRHVEIADALRSFFTAEEVFQKMDEARGEAERGKVRAAEAPTLAPRDKPSSDPRRAETLRYDRPQEDVGAVIAGRYKLLEALGQGGMGAVFMAQQTQPVKRVVALKLIKLGMDSKQVLARFEAERQALALMDHPNIAKVLDAGTTDSGRPFFVMELVKGVPISRFCDERHLSPRQRLELFIPVCQAIQHAHQKGIIHRDIKPTNVLVALYDDRPVPKVIDFGVAKAAGLQLTDASLVTGFGAIVGTPEYMSPEQAQLNQLDIDTRSDVYALGVVLYELLTGTTPIDHRRLGQGALFEVLRIIREEEPLRPSTRLSTSEALASIAATRATEPSKLAKLMRGELDWIVMKCLEKDRSRRYETANGLAHDLGRYLADEPVEACPPSSTYRLRKLAGKYKKTLVTATAFLVLLVAGLLVSSWLTIVANRAQHAAIVAEANERAQRESAEIERNRAVDAEDKEREQRKATETERDRAEHQLAIGLLRPIEFRTRDTFEVGPAELSSFADWSAIPDSRLKVRALEIAFESPETAFRVAQRADRVMQVCVGLSPTRRAAVLNLVTAKERAADPRIRVAACWMAFQLNSVDRSAWEESCKYFCDPKNKAVDLLGGFFASADTGCEAGQISKLSLEPLLAALEKSKDQNVHENLIFALAGLASQLDTSQVRRVADTFLALLANSPQSGVNGISLLASRLALGANPPKSAVDGLNILASRLEAAQVRRAGDAFIAMLSTSPQSGNAGLRSLASRLESAQAKRAADAYFAMLSRSPDRNTSGLIALAPRLESGQVKQIGDLMIADAGKGPQAVFGLDDWVTMAPRLEPTQATLAWNAMVEGRLPFDFSGGDDPAALLSALAARLDERQVAPAANELIASLQKSTDPDNLDTPANALAALVPRLGPAQTTRAADAFAAILSKSLKSGAKGLAALAPRLESARAQQAWNKIIAIAQKSDDSIGIDGWNNPFKSLAPRLQREQAQLATDALMKILEKASGGQLVVSIAADGLIALAPSREKSKANRDCDTLIAMLEKSPDIRVVFGVSRVLAALAPRLDATQAMRACNSLMAVAEESTDEELAGAFLALEALARQLDSGSRNSVALATSALLLDRGGDALGVRSVYLNGSKPLIVKHPPIEVARLISSPRSLAKLLSHPACVGEARDSLLRRFEELVLYDGKPVLWKPYRLNDEEKPAAGPQPSRRFQILQQAAAWIQQNWPDFDLETTCPVTWRDSR